RLNTGKTFSHMLWDKRDPRARLDLDQTAEPSRDRHCIVGAIAGTVNRLGALVGCIEKSVPAIEADAPESAVEGDFEAAPPCFAEILKITETRLIRCDEEDVLAVRRLEPPCAPVQPIFPSSPQARFKRPGDDLPERR